MVAVIHATRKILGSSTLIRWSFVTAAAERSYFVAAGFFASLAGAARAARSAAHLGNINALRRRAPHSWSPSPGGEATLGAAPVGWMQ